MKLSIKISLFISSFVPLFIMIVVRDAGQIIENIRDGYYFDIRNLFAFSLLISSVLSCLYVKFTLLNKNHIENQTYATKKIRNIRIVSVHKTISSDYLMAYLVPLIAFDFGTITGVFSFLTLFTILGSLYAKYNMINFNLMLEFKYKIFKADIYIDQIKEHNDMMLIAYSNNAVNKDVEMTLVEFVDHIYFQVG